ncbi:hypothetical protein HGRIS_014011 [Hohenbuehelia grisea]|uniref:Uncharacterized protein n=1 Tax=Hohenbuehelia grisea TaxID=104357 RepID=A0ABR3JS87_9AGAR
MQYPQSFLQTIFLLVVALFVATARGVPIAASLQARQGNTFSPVYATIYENINYNGQLELITKRNTCINFSSWSNDKASSFRVNSGRCFFYR